MNSLLSSLNKSDMWERMIKCKRCLHLILKSKRNVQHRMQNLIFIRFFVFFFKICKNDRSICKNDGSISV